MQRRGSLIKRAPKRVPTKKKTLKLKKPTTTGLRRKRSYKEEVNKIMTQVHCSFSMAEGVLSERLRRLEAKEEPEAAES